MSGEPRPPTIMDLAWMLALALFRREAVMVAAAVALLIAVGAGGVVWAQSTIDGGVKAKLAPIETRTAKVESDVEALKKQMANVERLSVETNANVRLVAEKLKVEPIELEPADGGR